MLKRITANRYNAIDLLVAMICGIELWYGAYLAWLCTLVAGAIISVVLESVAA